ncbi:MAG: hypothetical protein Q9228_006818 [Teloschistes exilis]
MSPTAIQYLRTNTTIRVTPPANDSQSNNINIISGLCALLTSIVMIWQGRRLLKSWHVYPWSFLTRGRRQEPYELDTYHTSNTSTIDFATPASANMINAAPAPESPDGSGFARSEPD